MEGMMRTAVLSVLAAVAPFLTAGTAFAQSGIAGVVKDTTGAVLPGVTVEASSPALNITLFNAPQPGTSAVDPTMIAVTEQSTGLQYRSPQGYQHSGGGMWTYRGSASYVTG